MSAYLEVFWHVLNLQVVNICKSVLSTLWSEEIAVGTFHIDYQLLSTAFKNA